MTPKPATAPVIAPLKTGRFKRHATWLELFYDLVYVVVIAKLAHLITHPHDGHITLHQYAVFATLFVPVWWAWTGHMMFQNRFDPDDTPQKILTLLQMLAACFMAVFITGVFAESANAFALSYVAIRTLLIQGGKFSVQAGAGIVADSDPAREHQETLDKIRALTRAVGIAEEGL